MDLAKRYRLPSRLRAFIPEHHGTMRVSFLYQKALEAAEVPTQVNEADFRYPGPKPQFREAALVMISDAVEAASRSMLEPTTAKLQALVQKLINQIFSEGQLDECDLTLKDLNLIANSFVHTLEGIYHARPAYPPGAVNPKGVAPNVLSLAKPTPERAKKAGS